MNGKKLSLIILLLAFAAAFMSSGPVFSGEHPWDADVTEEHYNDDKDDWYDPPVFNPDRDSVKGDSSSTDTCFSGGSDDLDMSSASAVDWGSIAIQFVNWLLLEL